VDKLFCSQCGKKLIQNAKFCGHCGQKAYVAETSYKKTDTGEIARKIKKELSNMPLIILISDAVQGASGLSILQEKIRQDPNNPVYWLVLL
jgi:uncharacterized membrane protein YvbJ